MTLAKFPSRQLMLGNAVAAVVQVIVSGASLFLLYRYVLHVVGIEALGMWSLAGAIFGLARIADGGLFAAVSKIGAEALADGRASDMARLLTTAQVVVAVVMGLVLTLFAWIIGVWPGVVGLPVAALPLLFLMALTTWLGAMTAILRAGLDAAQRSGVRNHIITVQSLVLLMLAWLLIPLHGLRGLVEAQALSAASGWFMSLSAIWWLRIPVMAMPNLSSLRDLLRFGMPFQVAGIASLCYEPVVKWNLGYWVGLESLGWYEMAARLVNQVRSLLVSAQEGLVPYLAAVGRVQPDAIADTYRETNRLNAALAVAIFPTLMAALPIISFCWIGCIETHFVAAGFLLCIGWWFNALVIPAYFAGQGTGLQRWNAWAHVLMLALILIIGPFGGICAGFIGVVVVWVVANICGSAVIVWGFHRVRGLPASAWICWHQRRWDLVAATLALLPLIIAELAPGANFRLIFCSALVTVFLISWSLFDPVIIGLIKRLKR